VSCGTIENRLERLSRQAIALHSCLIGDIKQREDVCIDGFVSFDRSQYFPNEITIAITRESRFVIDMSHCCHRRAGRMSAAQKKRSEELYQGLVFERKAIQRTFAEVLFAVASIYAPWKGHPLVLITDEKKEYTDAYHTATVFRKQDAAHRVARLTVYSSEPRTKRNPLFASNYLDREIRKDQANHRRETVCFRGMQRIACCDWCSIFLRITIASPIR